MNKTLQKIERNGRVYSVMALPDTNAFKFEIINWKGSSIERVYKEAFGKEVFGISHFIEHLGFKSTKDYTTDELMNALKKYGSYNASTDFDRINYYYMTTMDHRDKAINLVTNVAFNDFSKIPEDEYLLERDVVSNEAKRYKDDAQTSFYFQLTGSSFGYVPEDNVIGTVDLIDNFNFEDCKKIKQLFLNEKDHTYVIVYDPQVATIDSIFDTIEKEINRYSLVAEMDATIEKRYAEMLGALDLARDTIHTETDQIMTAYMFDKYDEYFTTRFATTYLARMAPDTSLTDYIREKHGLTYGINFYVGQHNYTQHVSFGCDVTPGTEELLNELFVKSVNDTTDSFTEEKYNEFISSLKLKDTLSFLDQKTYIGYAKTMFTNPQDWKPFESIFATDMVAGVAAIYKSVTFEKMKANLEAFKKIVNAKEYKYVEGKKIENI